MGQAKFPPGALDYPGFSRVTVPKCGRPGGVVKAMARHQAIHVLVRIESLLFIGVDERKDRVLEYRRSV